MKKSKIRDNIGTVVKLFPQPKLGDRYVSDSRNRWLILPEPEGGKDLVFQNTITNHEITLGNDNIREFRSPDIVIIRGQLILEEDAKVTFELFIESPEIEEVEDPQEILDDRRQRAESELGRLSDAEKTGLRELLVRGSMTDTDLSEFLRSEGYGVHSDFYAKVSTKTSFLKREFAGENTIKDVFKPILRKFLVPRSKG